MSFKNYIICIFALLFVTGCTFKTEGYKVDNNIVNKLNTYDLNKVDISNETNQYLNESNYKLTLRGTAQLLPSYGNSYSEYILLSLKQQLSQNDLLKDTSNTKIKIKLMQNDGDIWDTSTGYYDISINFKIIKDEKIIYDKNIQNKHYFPSAFIGNVAVENAIINYPIAVQKVINKFLTDEDTIKSIKK